MLLITGKKIEELFRCGRLEDGLEILLKEMLYFLGDMPIDNYHDYRDFRHKGLVDYLVYRFMDEKWNKKYAEKCGLTHDNH